MKEPRRAEPAASSTSAGLPDTADELDAQAMRRLAAGEDAALNELMERHASRLFRHLIRSLQDENDAADLAQETFVRVFQHRARFNPHQRFATWLYTIAGNLVKDRYRWRTRHPQVSIDAEGPVHGERLRDILPQPGPNPTEQSLAEERAEAVRQAIAALPEELRQPLLLAEYEDLSYADIAGILGCTAKAVETRLYRARQQLRSRLTRLLGPA